MILDIGLDKNYIITDIESAAFQELDILFGTQNTELINNPRYGTNFEMFLWDLTPNEEQLKSYIENKISDNTLFMKMLNYSIDVKTEEIENEKAYIVTIYIYRENKIINKKMITIK